MSKKFEDEIAALLRKHKETKEVNGQADKRESEERQDFLSTFRDKAQNTVRPVLELVERQVAASKTDIQMRIEIDNAKAELTAWFGEWTSPSYRLVFAPDFERKRITVMVKLPSSTRQTAAKKADELSEEFIEQQARDFLAQVIAEH